MLNELRAKLPASHPSLPLEDQARCVLQLLVDTPGNVAPSGPPDPTRCPNCDDPALHPSSPYCGEACREQAAFVRQLRAALVNGSALDAEKQLVFGQKLWWLLGGGLPLRESNIPESAKRQVVKRCAGKCESCGAPMTAVENWGSGCNRPLHLRAVCQWCSRTKPFLDASLLEDPEVRRRLGELGARVSSPKPIRACDDPEHWNWRDFIRARRDLLARSTA